MEVEVIISSSLDKISICNLLSERIGVLPGTKLRIYRDAARAKQCRMVLQCDKPTALHLKRRFRVSRAYMHDGELTSLTFVGMRPIVDQRDQHLEPARLASVPMGGGDEGFNPPSLCSTMTTASSTSSGARGVEFALRSVEEAEAEAEANGRQVPGIADLYHEFMRGLRKSRQQQSHAKGEPGEDMAGGDVSNQISNEERRSASSLHEAGGSSAEKWRWRRHPGWRWRKDENTETHNGTKKDQREWRMKAAHRKGWFKRHAFVSVEVMTLTLNRISRRYAHAPRPIDRVGTVSLLRKVYADGTAFADNRRRLFETLDYLEVVRWHARPYPQATSQQAAKASTLLSKGWPRILRRVVGLVRDIIDFGVFVQIYVMTVERERPRLVLETTETGERGPSSRNAKNRREKEPKTRRHRVDEKKSSSRAGPEGDGQTGAAHRCGRNRRLNLEKTTGKAETQKHTYHSSTEGPSTSPAGGIDPLLWLFPECGDEGGRRAFKRHAICGATIQNAVITLESAVSMIRDTGKVLPAEQAWRWFCESRTKLRGHMLGFPNFVEMCEELKHCMTDESVLTQNDQCCSAPVVSDCRCVVSHIASERGKNECMHPR